jgi:prophage tail gpP-like protein
MSRIRLVNATLNQELRWRSLAIKKSLDDICHTLTAELHPGERLKVRRHDKIQTRYENPLVNDPSTRRGGRLVTTALIDEITSEAGDDKHGVTIVGRSPARDIIDSTWSGALAGLTLRGVVRAIGGKFGIVCDTFPVDEPDPTAVVASFGWENESPWTKLITEADAQKYILTSNEAGNLYLWPVASSVRGEGFRVTEKVNVKTARWTENGAEQFHEYIARGGGVSERVVDASCGGNRVLTINMDDPQTTARKLRRRAEMEARRRKETRTRVMVAGWGLTDEELARNFRGETDKKEIFWIPNAIIPVSIPSLGLDTTLLICEVEYEASAESFGATLTLVNRDAYT